MHVKYAQGQLIVTPLTNDEGRLLLAIAKAYLRSTSQVIEPVARCSKADRPRSKSSRPCRD